MVSPKKNELDAMIVPENIRVALKQFYQTSEAYAEHLEKETESYFARYMRLIEQYARGAENVLDLGCGTGLSSLMLSRVKRRVVGMDLSEFFLRRGGPLRKNPNLSLLSGDMLELPFANESFDLIGTYLVISFLPNIPQALDEMVRVLRPGGSVLIITPNQLSPIYALTDFFKLLMGKKGRPVFTETPAQALKTFASNLRLSLAKLLKPGVDFLYRTPDLTGKKVVGAESDAVYRSSAVDFVRYFQGKGFSILRVGSRNNWLEKILPLWANSIELVARKN